MLHDEKKAGSLLWYEPWAAERIMAVSLWKECAKRIDWEMLAKAPDSRRRFADCGDPANVPPTRHVQPWAVPAPTPNAPLRKEVEREMDAPKGNLVIVERCIHEHQAIRWMTLEEMNKFEFAPADQELVNRIFH